MLLVVQESADIPRYLGVLMGAAQPNDAGCRRSYQFIGIRCR
jgi:hypothetical protein